MKGAGIAVLLAVLALGVLSSLGYVLYLFTAITLVYGIIAHPRSMAAALGLALIASIVDRYPLAGLGLLTVVITIVLVNSPRKE